LPSQALARGITKTGVAVEMIHMRSADPQEVTELVGRAQGLVVAVPPTSGGGAPEPQATLGTILAAAQAKQTFGWSNPTG
jgi:flavorubredoxin